MTITRIKVTTLNNTYTEYCYSLVETVDRITTIQCCDNVIGIEVMSMETGEILYYESPVETTYVSPSFCVDLATEILD